MLFASALLGIKAFENYYNPLFEFEKISNNNGVFKEYFKNGKLKSHEEYLNGLKHGKSIFFNEKGDTLEFFNFEFGKKHGWFKYFTNDGKPVWIQIYKHDTLVQDTILNDSLYNFVFKAYDTGMLTFDQSCANCHTSNDEIALFHDTLLTVEKLDTTHLCIVDTIPDEKTRMQYLSFNSKQLQALKFYINELKRDYNQKKQPQNIPRGRRKKIVEF
jgi:hypothetical protein